MIRNIRQTEVKQLEAKSETDTKSGSKNNFKYDKTQARGHIISKVASHAKNILHPKLQGLGKSQIQMQSPALENITGICENPWRNLGP